MDKKRISSLIVIFIFGFVFGCGFHLAQWFIDMVMVKFGFLSGIIH